MGLDMSLYAFPSGVKPSYDRDDRSELAYWRKANAIHNFFIEWRGRGEYRNGEFLKIYPEDLHNLRERCVTVLANHDEAPHMLPTTSGFFFGSEYDGWYFNDLEETIKHVDKIFEEGWFDECDVYYEGNW